MSLDTDREYARGVTKIYNLRGDLIEYLHFANNSSNPVEFKRLLDEMLEDYVQAIKKPSHKGKK